MNPALGHPRALEGASLQELVGHAKGIAHSRSEDDAPALVGLLCLPMLRSVDTILKHIPGPFTSPFTIMRL